MTLLKLGVAAATALVCSATTTQAERQWAVYQPPGGRFRVELPEKPTVKNETARTDYGPARATYATTAQDSDLACTVRSTDYQPGALGSDPQVFFDRTKRNLATRASVKSEVRLSMGTAPAVRLDLEMPDKSARYHAVVVGDRAITVVCTFPKGQENSPDVLRVFKSFTLTKQ